MAKSINTVLIIADNHNQRFYSSIDLCHEKVELAAPGQSLDFIRRNSTDLILLDSGVDPERGLNLLVEIKRHVSGTPIIFLTDVRSYDTAVNAYKAGARDYIKKPVSIRELSRIITGLLVLKRKSIEEREPFPCAIDNVAFCESAVMNTDVPAYIHRTVSYIENNLSRINDLEDIAGQANLSVYHFSRIFKKYTGLSPMEFVRVMKMHKAKELLRADLKPVAMVAEEVGYVDVRSFERQFKQLTGSTPSRFRKSFQR